MTEELQSARLPTDLVRRLQKRIEKTNWWVDGPNKESLGGTERSSEASALCLSLPGRSLGVGGCGGGRGSSTVHEGFSFYFPVFKKKKNLKFVPERDQRSSAALGGRRHTVKAMNQWLEIKPGEPVGD